MEIEKTASWTASGWEDYALLDSGRGRKLEQFGTYRLARPEPRAEWKSAWPEGEWAAADGEFHESEQGSGAWALKPGTPKRWELGYKGLKFWVELEVSKQVGVFPENGVHWDWIGEKLRESGRHARVLNLFGYTGLASLAAAQAGAEVTHIDSSRRAIRLGRENQVLSGLEEAPIRWIPEDALKFVQREIKRGRRYDGLVLDPPTYGLGPKKERWEFSKDFEPLCVQLRELLSEAPLFVVVTAYLPERSPEMLAGPLEAMVGDLGGRLTLGELVTVERSAGRKITYAVSGRWEAVGSR